jgi:uncharacterized protein (TIGR02266 family)
MADARKDKRTLLSLKIRYKSASLEDFIERYSNDISRGGVFIKAQKPLAVGTLLKFDFLLQDQSTLIHGVGRVVWRRDEHEADANNPAGMGIKFIKMDPASRAVVQRIVEDRVLPGVFDQGKEGIRGPSAAPSDPSELGGADQTKVRHVSEFLASALEEGGARPAATRAARAGAEQARQRSTDVGDRRTAARGAFSALRDAVAERGRSSSEAPARGAMSAFGGSTASGGARRGSSAAPALPDLDAEDDFLDEETTKVKELALSDYPDADATAVAKDISPFLRERRPTPVVPSTRSSSPLEDAVPDLFGSVDGDSNSFGPAPGEFIDPRLLDPAVPTVPPRAATLPEPKSGADEVFQVPKAAPAVADKTKPAQKRRTRGWLALLLLVLLLMAAAVAALRLGLLDGLLERVIPGFGRSAAVVEPAAVPGLARPPAKPSVNQAAEPRKAPGEPSTIARAPAPAPEDLPEPAPSAEKPASVPAPQATTARLRVLSIPSGAFVSVDGKPMGRTPLDLEREVGSELSIVAKARGFLARRETAMIRAGQEPLKLVLSALPYAVEVATEPSGAKVSAVGGGEGVTPAVLEMKAMSGSRKVVISKDGYKTVTKSLSRASFVEEPRRMVATISVTLEPEGAPRAVAASQDGAEATDASATPPSAEAKPNAAEQDASAPAKPAPTAGADEQPEASSETPAAAAP